MRRRTISPWIIPLIAGAMALAIPMMPGGAVAQTGPPGNNGTVKVDETPFDDHPDNEPHVGCTFQIDWYNFDANATSAVTFETQNPTGTRTVMTGTVQLDGDDNEGGDEDGLDGSATYTLEFTDEDFLHPNQGYHVKLTINTEWSNGSDVKHKAFWVTGCLGGTSSPTTSSPTTSSPTTSSPTTSSPTTGSPTTGSPTTSSPTTSSPTIGGVSSTTGSPTVLAGGETNTSSPSPLAFTGAEDLPWLLAALITLLVLGTLALRIGSRSEPAEQTDWSK